ncbi:MAG: hypothetical protein AAGK09_10460 [Planctomycetota bacterium]
MQFWTTKDGREVRLDQIYLDRTYSGLVEGRPNERYNSKKIIFLQNKMRSTLGEMPLLMIQPEVNLVDERHPELPGLCLGASYISYEPADSPHMASWLTVMWFAEDTDDFEITQSARQTISDVVWNDHAAGFDW